MKPPNAAPTRTQSHARSTRRLTDATHRVVAIVVTGTLLATGAPLHAQDAPTTRGAARHYSPIEPVRRAAGYDEYRITYVGGEPASVWVKSLEGDRLELTVTDANGQVVCRSQLENIEQACHWSPIDTAEYLIAVGITGSRDAAYRLWTN
jgi:hypothetical protein